MEKETVSISTSSIQQKSKHRRDHSTRLRIRMRYKRIIGNTKKLKVASVTEKEAFGLSSNRIITEEHMGSRIQTFTEKRGI